MNAILGTSTNVMDVAELLSSGDMTAEAVMLKVQMLMAEEFDDQLRDIGDRIKLLNQVKKKYRKKINTIKEFMSQRVNHSRSDSAKFYDASFKQMAELCGALSKTEYSFDEMKMTGETAMTITDSGEKHTLDEKKIVDVSDGSISMDELVAFFEKGAGMDSSAEACEYAKDFCGDEGSLPFYLAKPEFFFENGQPKFAVYEEPLNRLMEEIENYMSDVEEESEELGVQVNQLNAQRKSALDGMNQLHRKIEEMRKNTISKIGG